MSDAVVELAAVTKDYGRSRILHGVDLQIGPAELAALMGPSGSGKSTLLNLIGLLDRPTAGRVVILGRDTGRMAEADRTRLRGSTIGFVFQFHHLLPSLTAMENVRLPRVIEAGRVRAGMEAAALDLLTQFGLGDRGDARVSELSGGEQQRVAIARALALGPALVLADEPTGNLDTHASDRVFDLMRRINRDLGTAFLIVTHDPRIAERCDRVIELVDGRIRADRRRDTSPRPG